MEMLSKPCGQISRPQHRSPRHGKLCAPRGATVRIVRRNRRLGKRPWLTRGGRVYARSSILSARALRGLAAACVIASVTIAVVPGVASAHASLKDSTPKDESTVTSELDVIELEFTDDVTDPRVEVLDAGGQNHADGEVVLDGAMVQQAVGGLESGEYVVAYQVVSADGDPVSGTITFTLDLPEPTPQAQPTTEEIRPRATAVTAPTPEKTNAATPEVTTATTPGTDDETVAVSSSGSGPLVAALVAAALVVGAGVYFVVGRFDRRADVAE